MNIYLVLAAVLGALLLAGGSAQMGYRYAKGQAAREELLIQKAGDAAAERAATAIAGIKITHKTIQNEIERTLEHVPDPDLCRIGPDTLRLLNDALAGRAPEDTADRGVPGAASPAD